MLNIKTDSRKIKQGDIFVALDGISSNGSEYINEAIKNGASLVVTSKENNYDVKTLVVPDTRKYLEDYLKSNYNNLLDEMTLVAFTGTNGKTTSAYLLYSALNLLNINCAYIGTIGYYLKDGKEKSIANTTPDLCDMYELIIDAYDKGYRHVCLEASSQGIAMGRIKTMSFDYCVFTNLTPDHLDYHKTMENYANTKKEVFKQLKKSGISLINVDDKYHKLYETTNCYTYGSNLANYQFYDEIFSTNNTTFNYKFKDKEYKVISPLLGKHNIYNLVSVMAILDLMKIDFKDITNIINKLQCPPGRMDTVCYKENNIIIDYAHTADAFLNIINSIKETKPNNMYIVFGCTGNRDTLKRKVMTKIALTNAKHSVLTIDDPHDEDPNNIIKDMLEDNVYDNYEVELDRKKAIEKGINCLEKNDVLLILGKGHEDFIIYGKQRIPFNDKKVVNKIIKEQ